MLGSIISPARVMGKSAGVSPEFHVQVLCKVTAGLKNSIILAKFWYAIENLEFFYCNAHLLS
jgi:hypothetical protein